MLDTKRLVGPVEAAGGSEIVALFEREVVGRIPKNVPSVKWEVRETQEISVGGRQAIERHVVGVVDNSACPEIEVDLSMSLTVPKESGHPVPVLMMFGWTPFDPSPFGPGRHLGEPLVCRARSRCG